MSHQIVHLISIAAPFRCGVADMNRPPSAILYVGGYLRQGGFDVKLHHISEAQIHSTVEAIVADPNILLVGFSVITGVPVATSQEMSRLIKEARPDITVVWGGIHPSLMPRQSLQSPYVDYVIIGEGEVSLLELAKQLRDGFGTSHDPILGLAYKSGQEVIINPPRPFEIDLDQFSQDWSLLDIRNYVREDLAFYFITSRGCPHNCGFCYNQQFNQRKWRGHSVEFVVRELQNIQKQMAIRHVVFDDDNFFTDKARGLEIIRRLKEIGIGCKWVEIRCDYIDQPILEKLTSYGVEKLFIGWESGSTATLKKIAKGYSRDLIIEKFQLLGQYPMIEVDASAIIGFPWESRSDVKQTVSMALNIFRSKPYKVQFNIGTFIPYPGAPILKDMESWKFSFPDLSEKWRKYDIIDGSMSFPWANLGMISKYKRIDRYAKLLYIKKHSSKKRYILAFLAYIRLKFGLYFFPFELWRENRIENFSMHNRQMPIITNGQK